MRSSFLAAALVLTTACSMFQSTRTKTPQEQAGQALATMTQVVNVADAVLAPLYRARAAQVRTDPRFLAAARDGYECGYDPATWLPTATVRLSGLNAAMCFYKTEMRGYDAAATALGSCAPSGQCTGARGQLISAAKLIDAGGDPKTTTLISVDAVVGVVRTVRKAGVRTPPELDTALVAACAAVRVLTPAATNCTL